MKDAAAEDRIRLAARILLRKIRTGAPPTTLEDIARLRFLAETDAEREMPVEQLARVVIEREQSRKGYPPSSGQLPRFTPN